MVDFGEMLRDLNARRANDPAYQAYLAREAKMNETRREISSIFERKVLQGKESVIAKTWTKTLTVRREPSADGQADIIRFFDAPTGHEAYVVDAGFVERTLKRAGERLYICAGTPNSWDACSIAVDDLIAYLKENFSDVLEMHPPAETETTAAPAI